MEFCFTHDLRELRLEGTVGTRDPLGIVAKRAVPSHPSLMVLECLRRWLPAEPVSLGIEEAKREEAYKRKEIEDTPVGSQFEKGELSSLCWLLYT